MALSFCSMASVVAIRSTLSYTGPFEKSRSSVERLCIITTCTYYLLWMFHYLTRSLPSRTWWGGIVTVSPPWTTPPRTRPSGFPSSSSTRAGRPPLIAASPVTSEGLLPPSFVLCVVLGLALNKNLVQILCSVCCCTVGVCVSVNCCCFVNS